MDEFTRLYLALDTTTKTTAKLAALSVYFQKVTEQDALWALWLLSGKTLRRALTSTQLKDWSSEIAGLPRWLFDEGYIRVGDLAETVSLVVPQSSASLADQPLDTWMRTISRLRDQTEPQRHDYVVNSWLSLGQAQKFIFTKLITGGFRVGASRALAVRALATAYDLDAQSLIHTLTGKWNPADTTLQQLTARQGTSIHPYPFFWPRQSLDMKT